MHDHHPGGVPLRPDYVMRGIWGRNNSNPFLVQLVQPLAPANHHQHLGSWAVVLLSPCEATTVHFHWLSSRLNSTRMV